MSFGGLDHIGFAVADLERSTAWYTRLLGEAPTIRKAVGPGYIGEIVGYPECRMKWALWRLPNNTMLELIQYLMPDAAHADMETYTIGNGHVCLVTDDIEGDGERMRGHAEFRSPRPVTIPVGPYQGVRAWYIRDPDGITVELIEAPSNGPQVAA
ncbi:MAG TPA: VOC family protein [Thermoleophilaceae bacterium]|nr:VOC family protein [Thermoleophilaceae bacterium]